MNASEKTRSSKKTSGPSKGQRPRRTDPPAAESEKPSAKSPRPTSPRGRHFTDAQREYALLLIASGMKRSDVAEAIGTTCESLRRWVGAAKAAGTMPTPPGSEEDARAAIRSPHALRDPRQGLGEHEVATILKVKRQHPSVGPPSSSVSRAGASRARPTRACSRPRLHARAPRLPSRPGGWPLSRLPPSGEPIGPEMLWRVGRGRGIGSASELLRQQLGVATVSLHASGREALRVGLRHLAEGSGRTEVVVPAYTCFSVPSAVVAAGLRVRLVDVDAQGWIDLADLESLPLDAVAAVVVCNLFGVPEAIAPVAERTTPAGVAVVDDAAQSLGSLGPEGWVGARGDLGVLSFGRGKPVGALGGGALAWPRAPQGLALPPEAAPGRIGALARALAFDVALWPPLFRLLAAIPALGIGETHFEPEFPHGAIPGAALALLAPLLPRSAEQAQRRAARACALAERIQEVEGWRPLLAPGPQNPVYPRLALIAPSAGARDRALRDLTRLGAGASAMYPASLDVLPELRSHLVDARECPGARDFAARVLTLPTHGGLRGARFEQALEVLRQA